MATIVASFTSLGVPATGLAATIRVRRTDTGALVVTDAAMTEQGDGAYAFSFAPTDGLDYSIRADGTATLPASERYAFGALSGATEARLEVDIPAVLVDTSTVEPIVSTSLDATISSRESEASAAGRAATDVAEHDTTQAAIASLNDIDGAAVQAAMTAQGYTPARAVLLDNLNATVTSVLAAIAALNDPTAAAIADAVWTEVLAAHETVGGSPAEALAALRNRIRIDYSIGPPRQLVVYAQDGLAELYRADLTTANGAEVLAFFGVQHERGSPA